LLPQGSERENIHQRSSLLETKGGYFLFQ